MIAYERETFTYSIYGLVCPFENEIKYVGCTRKTLPYRLNAHISNAKSTWNYNQLFPHKKHRFTEKMEWIYSLAIRGLTPKIILIAQTTDLKTANKLELENIMERWDSIYNLSTQRFSRKP